MPFGGAGAKCAPVLDQPVIVVSDGHIEKVDPYRGNDLSIRTVDIMQGKESIGDRDIGFDEADPVVGERRLPPLTACTSERVELSLIYSRL